MRRRAVLAALAWTWAPGPPSTGPCVVQGKDGSWVPVDRFTVSGR